MAIPDMGMVEVAPHEVAATQSDLEIHFQDGHSGPGDHRDIDAFVQAWAELRLMLSTTPQASLEAVRVQDIPQGCLPSLPRAERAAIEQGRLRAKPMFVAPEGQLSALYSRALATIPATADPVTEVFIMRNITFLRQFGSIAWLEFIQAMHTEGHPCALGIFLEETARPGQGRMYAVGPA